MMWCQAARSCETMGVFLRDVLPLVLDVARQCGDIKMTADSIRPNRSALLLRTATKAHPTQNIRMQPLAESTRAVADTGGAPELAQVPPPVAASVSAPPEPTERSLVGKTLKACVLYTNEGRDTNWSTLSLHGVKGIRASLRLPADKPLASKGDVLLVQVESGPYTHRKRRYVRAKLLRRITKPLILREFEANAALQMVYRQMSQTPNTPPRFADTEEPPSYVTGSTYYALLEETDESGSDAE